VEELAEQYGITISRETLRQWLIEAKLWRARRARVEHYAEYFTVGRMVAHVHPERTVFVPLETHPNLVVAEASLPIQYRYPLQHVLVEAAAFDEIPGQAYFFPPRTSKWIRTSFSGVSITA
jgi:hypothetical protein